MKFDLKNLIALGLALPLMSCDLIESVELKAQVVRNYEKQSLNLAKENRLLKAKISNLDYKIQTLKAQNNFLKIKDQDDMSSRQIANTMPPVMVKNDLVQQSTYKWKPTQVLAIGNTEFAAGNYEKAAQFLHSYAVDYNLQKPFTDKFLYQLGVASYNSGNHYDWSEKYLKMLIEKYPTSNYYRGAKLWRGLSFKQLGNNDEFFKVVEEFRLKYRNTKEWGILQEHYDEIRNKYKN